MILTMRVFFKRVGLGLALAAISYAAILVKPNWAFSHRYEHKNINVFSDQPIDDAIKDRLNEALNNLKHSELYEPNMQFNIYFCYNKYRLGFFARNPNVGGVVNGVISQNVFLRESDIIEDKIIPPGTWLMDADIRTLTYFLTHEMTHSMQSDHDRFMRITHPTYIMEGYADYVAKRKTFVFDEALAEYRSGHEFYAEDSPLYNRQHLAIAYLIDQESMTYKDILATKPDLDSVLEKLK